MAEKLLIIMMNTDPSHTDEVAAALFQATVAASMENDVEVILTGRTGELARQGFAAQFLLREGGPQSVYDVMKEAHEAGVIFKVCTPALGEQGGDLIPEIEEAVGNVYVICQALADNTVTFTY